LIRREVGLTAAFVFPLGAILAFTVYILRDVVIALLFTKEFSGARELFSVQLIGDVFKIVSWVLAYPMLARGATSWFVGTEVGFSVLYVVLARLSIPVWGAQGANAAFALTYVAYLAFLLINFRKFAFK
jgi:PST family polysaccharide transporter